MKRFWSLPCLLLIASPVVAQSTPNDNRRDETKSAEHERMWKEGLAHRMASCAALGNQEEIVLSQFALEHTKNEEVKAFAKQMIQAHGDYLKQLKPFAGPASMQQLHACDQGDRSLRSSADDEKTAQNNADNESARQGNTERQLATTQEANHENQDDQQREGHADDRMRNGGAHANRMGAIEREVAQECVNLTERELSEKKGREFDKAFIGWQIGAHTNILAELKTFERHASGDLKKVFAKGVETTEMHLTEAKGIMHRLESSSSSTAQSGRGLSN